MRRLLVLLVSFFFVVSCASITSAKVKKEQTGNIEGKTYTDSRYGFSISTIDNWKMSTEKETEKKSSLIRATIYKVNYEKSRESRFSAYETARPTIVITADTTSLEVSDYQNTFFGEESKIDKKIREAYIIKLDMLSNTDFANSNEIEIDSVKGVRVVVKKTYSKQVGGEQSGNIASGDSAEGYAVGSAPSKVSLVQDYIVGFVCFLKKGNVIYIIQFSCEREFIKINTEDFLKIIQSWKFVS
ncbi:MAG: hypothetical protein MUO85_07945 [candidate division Zixibacteria bacterium]|nr:hypothetical protein [candidate division Zixibacteria bacterium]